MGQKGKNKRSQEMLGKPTSWCQPDKIMHKHELSVTNDSRDAMLTLIQILHQENKDLRWQLQQSRRDHHKQSVFKKKKASPQTKRSSAFSEDLSGITGRKAKSKQSKDSNNLKSCQFCGTKHWWGSESCPAYGSTCNNCQMKNHFTNVCKKQAKNLK